MITPAVNPDFLAAYVANMCPLRTPRPFPGACVARLRPPPMDIQVRIVEIAARALRGLRGGLRGDAFIEKQRNKKSSP